MHILNLLCSIIFIFFFFLSANVLPEGAYDYVDPPTPIKLHQLDEPHRAPHSCMCKPPLI